MLYYNTTYISKRIDVAKGNKFKEYMIFHFLNYGFEFQIFVCNGCHDLTMLSVIAIAISDIAITTVKNVDYCCTLYLVSKIEAMNLLDNSVLEDRHYI